MLLSGVLWKSFVVFASEIKPLWHVMVTKQLSLEQFGYT